MDGTNQKKNEKQLLCLNDRQTTWCIFLSIVLLCITMVTSYIVGYRSAMRNVIEAAKKDSFADQVYTSLYSATLADETPVMETTVENKINIDDPYDIITVQDTQKLKGYLS